MAEILDIRLRALVGIVATVSGEKFISRFHCNACLFYEALLTLCYVSFERLEKLVDGRMKINSY